MPEPVAVFVSACVCAHLRVRVRVLWGGVCVHECAFVSGWVYLLGCWCVGACVCGYACVSVCSVSGWLVGCAWVCWVRVCSEVCVRACVAG